MFRRKDEMPHDTMRNPADDFATDAQAGSLLRPRQAAAGQPPAQARSEETSLLRKPAAQATKSQQQDGSRATNTGNNIASQQPRYERGSVARASAAASSSMDDQPTAMRMPLAVKEPIPSPAVEELKQSVTDRIGQRGHNSRSSEFSERRTSEKRVLTVGQDTVLKGEIATCDRLIVEGMVDAVLSDVHTIEIEESGMFKGSAIVEDAEISGQFDGDLEVKGRLTIHSTGCVTGKVSYTEIEIHRGGMISGKVVLAGQQSSASGKKADDSQASLLAEENAAADSKKARKKETSNEAAEAA